MTQLAIFYLAGAILLLAIVIVVYPTIKHRAQR